MFPSIITLCGEADKRRALGRKNISKIFKEDIMRRKLAFTGFIMGTSFIALFTAIIVIGAIELASYSGYVNFPAQIWAMIITEIVLSVTTLVLNSVAIPTTTTAQKMNKKKGIVITAIVFNFLEVLVFILALASSPETGILILYIIFLLGIIASNVLAIIDLANNSKAMKVEIEGVDVANTVEPETKTERVNVAKSSTATMQVNDLEEEINKLLLMKAKNLITDEEFEKLKAHAIEKRLG